MTSRLTLPPGGPILPVTLNSDSKNTTTETLALIDTGAELSILCSSINRHKLLHSDKDRRSFGGRVVARPVGSALTTLGQTEGFDFLLRIGLRLGESQAPSNVFELALLVREIEFRQSLPYRMILGRDVLRRLLFTYDGPAGEFSVAR